jgi:hypothetical protein
MLTYDGLKVWLICLLDFNGRKWQAMSPDRCSYVIREACEAEPAG